jgi:hypothetical protein
MYCILILYKLPLTLVDIFTSNMKINITIFLTLITVELFAQNSVTTIECDDVVKATTSLNEVSYQSAIETILNDKIETCSKEKRNTTLVSSKMNPFVFAVHTAYAQHRPLIISPDMIWLLICQGFTKHVDYHSEELRSKFVQFSGKRKISIATEPISMNFHKGNIDNPWELMFPAFADSINKYVGNDFSKLIVSKFSTTTPTDKAAFEVTLMDAMSNYFEYEVTTSCGIPQISLEGSLNDWGKIKENILKLKGYNIDNWINSLEPLIDEFINAKKGKINHEFWASIYKLNGGSGGPYIKGWLIKLFPYLSTTSDKPRPNNYIDKEPTSTFSGLKTNDFYNGISQADFIWNYFGTKFEMEFVAGFIGVKQDKVTLALRPEIGWAVKDRKKDDNSKTKQGK